MKKSDGLMEVMKGLSYLTQVGLSVAAPIILCLLAAGWLRDRFGLGPWILMVALLVGLLSGLMSLWNFLKYVQRRSNRRSEGDSQDKQR